MAMDGLTFISYQPLHRTVWDSCYLSLSRPRIPTRFRPARQRKLLVRLTYKPAEASKSVPVDLPVHEGISYPLLFCLALLASTVGSLIGAGGGVLLTPFLTALGFPQHKAHGTTLVVITATALISATKYAMAAHVSIPVACVLSVAAIITSPIGARYSAELNATALKRWFGALLILVSILLPLIPSLASAAIPGLPLYLRLIFLFGVGTVTGFLTGLLGIGGGTINVPVLVLLSFPQKLAQGTALLAMTVPSIRASLVHRRLGHIVTPILPALILGAFAGGFIGSSTAILLPETMLRWVCSACFGAIGVRYLSRRSKAS